MENQIANYGIATLGIAVSSPLGGYAINLEENAINSLGNLEIGKFFMVFRDIYETKSLPCIDFTEYFASSWPFHHKLK